MKKFAVYISCTSCFYYKVAKKILPTTTGFLWHIHHHLHHLEISWNFSKAVMIEVPRKSCGFLYRQFIGQQQAALYAKIDLEGSRFSWWWGVCGVSERVMMLKSTTPPQKDILFLVDVSRWKLGFHWQVEDLMICFFQCCCVCWSFLLMFAHWLDGELWSVLNVTNVFSRIYALHKWFQQATFLTFNTTH